MSKSANTTRDAYAVIRRILLTEWDPIGVSEFPQAQDEYDAYVPEVYRLLSRGAGTREMFEYLWWLETAYMGLGGNLQKTKEIAERLVELVSEGLL